MIFIKDKHLSKNTNKIFFTSIVLLIILPSTNLQAFADQPERLYPHLEASLDKSAYYDGNIMKINGTILNYEEGYNDVNLMFYSTGVILEPIYSFFATIEINPDKTFYYELLVQPELELYIGNWLLNIKYPIYNGAHNLYIDFDYLGSPIQLQTDKLEYYNGQDIAITGFAEVNQEEGIRVDVDFIYENGTAMPITYDTDLEQDGTFSGIIYTNDPVWDYYSGYITANATIQEYWNTVVFHYTYEEDMTNEVLYQMIMNFDSMMYDQQLEIDRLTTLIDALTIQVEILLDAPIILPLDAPIIISITADDPDDLDNVYSVDDVIIIQFDLDTNKPGGNGFQTKQEVNDLFTFSDIPAQAYNGQWITPDTFIITVKSINNAEITIGTTTVTPTGITPILPADNSPNPSYESSPELIGDWGLP